MFASGDGVAFVLGVGWNEGWRDRWREGGGGWDSKEEETLAVGWLS